MRRLLAVVLLAAPVAVWGATTSFGPPSRTGGFQGGATPNYYGPAYGNYQIPGYSTTPPRTFQAPGSFVQPWAAGGPTVNRAPGFGQPWSQSGMHRWSGSEGFRSRRGFGYPFGYGYAYGSSYGGWFPFSPFLLGSGYGGGFGLGPFGFEDAVVFGNPPDVPVYGAQAPMPPSVVAPAASNPVVGGAPAGDTARAVRRLVEAGDTYFGRGEFARAVEAYRAAARNAPDDPMAAFALGHGLFAMGVYTQAAAQLRLGLTLYPAMVQVAMNRRAFYGDPVRFDEQVGRLAQYVDANPGDADARFLLGYNYFFSGRRAEAKAQFDALGPQDPIARLFLQELNRGQ